MAAPPVANWQAQILKGIGAPVTPQNLTFLNAWARAEGGGATNNPMNTTQPAPGASSYNSVGVRNYVSPEQGIQATVQTLRNGHYGNIIGALQRGDNAKAAASALAASPWGTGSLVEKMLGGAAGGPTAAVGPVAAPPAAAPTLPSLSAPRGAPAAPLPRGLPSPLLAAVNTGNEMFGLPPLPAQLMTPVAPAAAPTLSTAALPAARVLPAPPAGAGRGAAIAKSALTQLGMPYQWGGLAKLGSRTDCSGLLQASAAANGVRIARTTYDQFKQGAPVRIDQLQPGDAVFSEPTSKGPGHVSIYIGNGKLVEDPHTGAVVRISDLHGRRGIVGARRY